MIVKVAKKNNGNIELDDIGEIQDLDGEITDLYSQLLSIKSDIKEAEKKGDTSESDKLKVKYNKKREELNKCISRYSKELYKLSETKKKTKATLVVYNSCLLAKSTLRVFHRFGQKAHTWEKFDTSL